MSAAEILATEMRIAEEMAVVTRREKLQFEVHEDKTLIDRVGGLVQCKGVPPLASGKRGGVAVWQASATRSRALLPTTRTIQAADCV